jgi:xanthine dehydrogenase large subunit
MKREEPHAPAVAAALPHESARAHVTGTATYIDDIPEIKGTLHAAPILSNIAHGKLKNVDVADALAMPGVHTVLLSRDIPADPILGNFAHDEPIFATDTVNTSGKLSAWSLQTR